MITVSHSVRVTGAEIYSFDGCRFSGEPAKYTCKYEAWPTAAYWGILVLKYPLKHVYYFKDTPMTLTSGKMLIYFISGKSLLPSRNKLVISLITNLWFIRQSTAMLSLFLSTYLPAILWSLTSPLTLHSISMILPWKKTGRENVFLSHKNVRCPEVLQERLYHLHFLSFYKNLRKTSLEQHRVRAFTWMMCDPGSSPCSTTTLHFKWVL